MSRLIKKLSLTIARNETVLAVLQILTVVAATAMLVALVVEKWRHPETRFLERVTLLFSYAVPIFAMLWAARDAKIQRTRTEEVARSMSTRYIGDFPRHVDEITQVVTNAQQTLRFMADCVDYASFSYPEGHERLHKAVVETKKAGSDIRIVTWRTPAHITRSSPLFAIKNDWEGLRRSEEFERFFQHYKNKPKTLEEFNKILSDRERRFREELLTPDEEWPDRTVKIHRGADKQMDDGALFLWIADNIDAVFVLLSPDPDRARVAFRTRDTKIIESLSAIFDDRFAQSE